MSGLLRWRHGGGLALSGLWLVVAACAGRGGPSADARDAATLPPLPTTATAALPDDGEHVVQLSLTELRASPQLSQTEDLVASLPCLRQTQAPALLRSAQAVAVAGWSSGSAGADPQTSPQGASRPGPGFVAFIEGSGTPEAWLTAFTRQLVGRPQPLQTHQQGRYRRTTGSGHAASRLTPQLLMLGTEAHVTASERRMDDPAAPHAGYWLQVGSEFRPAEGRVLSWATERFPEAAAANLARLLGARVAGALVGAQVRVVIERAPVAVRLEAQLASAEAAQAVRREVHRKLDGSSFLLRLSGLPLDKRLESSQTDSVVRFDLPLQAAEVQRIVALVKAAWPPLARDICGRLQTQLPREGGQS